MQDSPRVLEISASSRNRDSVSRRLSKDLLDALRQRDDAVSVVRRDLADGVPFIDASWVEATFTSVEERSERHREALAFSDELVAELQAADTIVIATPMYNFGIPAALKAWIDLIARAGVTFRYTATGPEGLLKHKKAYVIVASGGVPVGSPVDFVTPYLKHALAFVGIDDVEIVAADQLNSRAEESVDLARARIAELVHTGASNVAA
jgi:FMN-dependent NADH-azoreductase